VPTSSRSPFSLPHPRELATANGARPPYLNSQVAARTSRTTCSLSQSVTFSRAKLTNMQTKRELHLGFSDSEAWKVFASRYSGLLVELPKIYEAANAAFARVADVPSVCDKAVFGGGQMCLEYFEAIVLLSSEGFWASAQTQLRAMYEHAVTARYLHQHPNEAEDFRDYFWVSMHKILEAWKDRHGSDDELNELLSDTRAREYAQLQNQLQRLMQTFRDTPVGELLEALMRETESGRERFLRSNEELARVIEQSSATFEQVEQNYRGVRQKNSNTRSWSRLDFVSMAKAVGQLGDLLDVAYYKTIQYAHPSAQGITSHIHEAGSTSTRKLETQQRESDEALKAAHKILLDVLRLQLDHFAPVGLESALKDCDSDFDVIWLSPTKAVGSSPIQ
jgi:hypothetical protein